MPNRLIHETSPYLRQHAENPVDWMPWGPEAFAEAKRRDVPILLSIGYSSCHWCHVMERESFADARIAARLNSHFVNVKVDREERPDVDEVYLRAVQAMNEGRGGWPATVFLDPEGRPFFGGTYFPPVRRGDQPGLVDIAAHVADAWRKRRADVETVGDEVRELLRRTGALPAAAPALGRDWLDVVALDADQAEDPEHGGFGKAPKFPPHGALEVLVAHVVHNGDARTRGIVLRCLDGMARGGVYDLVGGGFHRYSVDAAWRVPHFEKMLYDSAQLVPRYVDGSRLRGGRHLARIAHETLGFLATRMRLPDGRFAASLDADDPGGEGAFYTWTPAELRDAVGTTDGDRLAALLQVTEAGSFEDGRSVLRAAEPLEHWRPGDLELWARARPVLAAARDRRPAPARDDKAITAWNALAVRAFASGALLDPRWGDVAVDALDAVWAHGHRGGRLYRTGAIPGFADDHANLLQACLDAWELRGEPRHLDRAITVADALVDLFLDPEEGGFFLVGRDQESPLVRSKQGLGGAEPGANGVGALGLVRLGKLLGRQDLLDHAERIARSVQAWLARAPRVLGAEAIAGAWLATGGQEIAVLGPDAANLWAEIDRTPLPFAVRARRPDPRIPWLAGKEAPATGATAFVCEGQVCRLPTADRAELRAQLDEAARRRAPAVTKDRARAAAPELPDDPERWIGPARTLSALRGAVVVLHFFTTCSVNCLHVLPELEALEERFAGRPFAVIGVHSGKFPRESERDAVEKALARLGVRHPVLHDPDHAVWEAYAVRSWPTLVVVDPGGKIALQEAGEVQAEELEGVVARLLGERPDDTATGPIPLPTGRRRSAAEAGRELRYPGKVAVWPDALQQELGADPWRGRVYVSDTGHHRIVEYEVQRGADGWPRFGMLRAFGTSGEAGFDGAHLRAPQGLRRHEGLLYVADTGNHALRAVDLATGEIATLAGTGRRGVRAPSREALRTPRAVDLRSPWDVDLMVHRDTVLVFLAMAGQHQIWVYGAGHLGILAGSGREDHVDGPAAAGALAQPSGLAWLGRYLVFVDAETSSVRALDLQSHQLVTLAGRGLFDFGDVDGPPGAARLQHPTGLALGGDEVFVADSYNHKVRGVSLSGGDVRTVAGGPGVFDEPGGLARLGEFLLVADTNHHRLCVLHPETGEVRALR